RPFKHSLEVQVSREQMGLRARHGRLTPILCPNPLKNLAIYGCSKFGPRSWMLGGISMVQVGNSGSQHLQKSMEIHAQPPAIGPMPDIADQRLQSPRLQIDHPLPCSGPIRVRSMIPANSIVP